MLFSCGAGDRRKSIGANAVSILSGRRVLKTTSASKQDHGGGEGHCPSMLQNAVHGHGSRNPVVSVVRLCCRARSFTPRRLLKRTALQLAMASFALGVNGSTFISQSGCCRLSGGGPDGDLTSFASPSSTAIGSRRVATATTGNEAG